jgi:nucleoside-diphosphate-sugar epimerase
VSQTVLIIGGAGFIGAHLARELLRSGYKVRISTTSTRRCIGNGEAPRPTSSGDAELIAGDVATAIS